jgi:hypothetical protein
MAYLEELTLFATIGPSGASGPQAKLNASTCKVVAIYLAVKGMLERDECPKELVTLRTNITGWLHVILHLQVSLQLLTHLLTRDVAGILKENSIAVV